MIYKSFKNNIYNIYTIKTNKFKTCHMEIIFRNNLVREDITKRSVLTELLVENSNKYKTRKETLIKLEELYNASIYGITNRVGSSILTSICFDFINPKLVQEEIDEFIKYPLSIIENPNITNNEFDSSTFDYIKLRVKKDIESIIEDPKNYSISKLLEKMCPDTESSININGYLNDLELITNTNLYEYYTNMLKHDYIDIYLIGDIDMNKATRIIKDTLNINILKNHIVNYEINNKTAKRINKIYENYNFSQENICMGLNIINPTEYEKNYVANIYNMILGGGSLETKLYNKLRNENSLCYNCSSIYQKYDNLILIHTAISKENESLAYNLIKKSLNEMINNITDDEIENAKELMITTLNMSLDNPGRIVDNYVFSNYFKLDSIDERIKKYKSITKKDIINFAKKIKINTVLYIRDGENEKN